MQAQKARLNKRKKETPEVCHCVLWWGTSNVYESPGFNCQWSDAVPVHTMRTQNSSTGIDSLILMLGARWRWVVKNMPRPFYPWEGSRYLLNRRLCGPHNWSGQFGEETNFLLLPGFKPWIIQPITYSLAWLHYPCSLQLSACMKLS
jgi:hypothetical protein